MQKQIPFAASQALNDTGKFIVKRNQMHMRQVFNNPVRFTINAFYAKPAKRDNLTVSIRRKRAADGRNYLERQQVGGARNRKGIESMADANMPYKGNLRAMIPTSNVKGSPGRVTAEFMRALPHLGASRPQAAYARTRYDKANAKPAKRTTYFVGYKGSGAASDGIYKRTPRGVKKMFHLVDRKPQYQSRFKFTKVAATNGRSYFPSRFRKRLREAYRSIRI